MGLIQEQILEDRLVVRQEERLEVKHKVVTLGEGKKVVRQVDKLEGKEII